jgi:hypothetical protein
MPIGKLNSLILNTFLKQVLAVVSLRTHRPKVEHDSVR